MKDEWRAPFALAETVSALTSGDIDLHMHVDHVCNRIDQVDARVHALLPEDGRRDRLHREASAMLERFAVADGRPILFGALVGVKDIFHVDGFVSRAGTAVPAEAFAGPESAVARRLRAAGALILGKTVTTEFAYFEPGPTRNPHNLSHTPGGSSSGSAAAVAAGLSPLAIGTQTIGSVIRPAAFCGVIGFKPTFDRIATQGVVYFSPTVDHVGMFTQDVAGMVLAAQALCDAWRVGARASNLIRIGVPEGPYLQQASEEALARLDLALGEMEAGGATIVRVPALGDIAEVNAWHRRLVFAEFARQHQAIFERHEADYRPRTREIILLGQRVSDSEIEGLRERRIDLRARIANLMVAQGIDAWATPAAVGSAPEGIDATGDPNMNLPWTTAGMPALTLPAGRAEDGLPLGLQLIALCDADEELLELGRRYEGILGNLSGNRPSRIEN